MADKRYLFGDLLQSGDGILAQVSDKQSEQIFLFLEMWKVFFPGGDPLVAPVTLQPFDSKYKVQSADQSGEQLTADERKIRLLSRVFCMFSLEDTNLKNTNKVLDAPMPLPYIDFDIAQFCTLIERFKFTWRTTLEVILFRAFLSGRSSLVNI